MAVTPQTPKCHHNLGYASVVVTFGSLWCHAMTSNSVSIPSSNSLCVTFGKVSTGMASRGAQWCGVANPKNNASDPVSKTVTAASASKAWFAKLPSGVSLLYPKQCIALETVPCDHPVIFHEFCLCTAVGMSTKWGIPVPNLSLLVLLCLVFVGKCIGKVINFKWLSKNINPSASNLIGRAKFVVAVVGPVTLLSTDGALESRVPKQSPGSGNTNVTIAITNLCHSLTSHHACTSAAANEKAWVAQWTTRWYPGWSTIILSYMKNIETKTVYFDNQKFRHGLSQEKFSIRQSDL